MAPMYNSKTSTCSVSTLSLAISIIFALLLALFLLSSNHTSKSSSPSACLMSTTATINADSNSINVYVSDLPRSFNYELLDKYWSLSHDSRLGSDIDNQIRSTNSWNNKKIPIYPESPLIKQYSAEFCLHPAGDTPTSSRLFDAIQSLCVPVIISDNIELPFEDTIDYTDFSVFVAVSDALQPNWLVNHLRSFTDVKKSKFRQNMAQVQSFFEYDNGYPGGIGPVPVDGAVNHIWRKVHQKLPMIKEAIIREKRKPPNVTIPRRCHCT